MQGHNRKEHLETIRGALTTAAKTFGCLVLDIARPAPRAAATAANTKSADIAAQPACAGTDYTGMVDAFMAEWPRISAARGTDYYGPQSPALVGVFILVQSGLVIPPFNAKDLAAHPAMATAYDWLPADTQARIGDIAVYGQEQGYGYGTCGVVANLSPRHRAPVIYTQGPGTPWTTQLGTNGLLGYHRKRD